MPAPLLLLRNADVFDPAPIGRRDLLCGGGKILAVSEHIDDLPAGLAVEVVDVDGARVVPGLVDSHVHVTGGGGEAGYASRVPPLVLSQLSLAGVTTVVGLLGTDTTTRSVRELVARTYALREEGLGAFCWTGSYEVPVKTLTGSVRDDIVFVEPVLGVGELAISDHRSSQPSLDELLRVAADAHVGGLMTGKAGVVHLHLGDGTQGLEPVRAALERSELPARVFHPTHVNRNPRLLDEAMQLAADPDPGRTPFVDLTAFAPEELGDAVAAADAMASWFARGLSADRLTCSSDGGGCMPRFDADGHVTGYGVGQASTLLQTVRAAVLEHGLALGEVLPVFTRNPATLLRLPGKGRIRAGADADLLVLASDLSLRATVAGGRFLVRDGRALVRGAFE